MWSRDVTEEGVVGGDRGSGDDVDDVDDVDDDVDLDGVREDWRVGG